MFAPFLVRRLSVGFGLLFLVVFSVVYGLNRYTPVGPVSMEEASKLDRPHVRSSFSPKNQGDDAQARFKYE